MSFDGMSEVGVALILGYYLVVLYILVRVVRALDRIVTAHEVLASAVARLASRNEPGSGGGQGL